MLGSFLQQCNTLFISGFVDNVIFHIMGHRPRPVQIISDAASATLYASLNSARGKV